MKIGESRLPYRIQTQIKRANGPVPEFANYMRYPRVIKKFHLITPYALRILDQDLRLLERLDKCFKKLGELTPELVVDLMDRSLSIKPFGRQALFYGLHGPGKREQEVYNAMLRDYNTDPTIGDIAHILELGGIELDILSPVLSNLGPARIKTLHAILDPRRSDLCSFMRKNGVERVAIVFSKDEANIVRKPSEKDNKNTIYIPIENLNTTQNLSLMIIAVMR